MKNGDIPASHVNLPEGRYMWPSFGANERLFRLQKQLRCQLKMLGDLRNMTVNMSDENGKRKRRVPGAVCIISGFCVSCGEGEIHQRWPKMYILSYLFVFCLSGSWSQINEQWQMVEPCLFHLEFSMSIAAVKLDEAPVGEQEFGL